MPKGGSPKGSIYAQRMVSMMEQLRLPLSAKLSPIEGSL